MGSHYFFASPLSRHLYLLLIVYILDVMSNDTTAEGAVRLVGGTTPLEGRVEVFLFGQWGTVCSYFWDLAEATVVCHQLGYLRAAEAPGYSYFGAESGPSWYSNVHCTGTERNLTECINYSYYDFRSSCLYFRITGVVCSSQSQNTPLHLSFTHMKMLY